MPLPPIDYEELPLGDAPARYGIGRTALHARIRHCRIVPLRSGNRAFLSREHVAILDDLHNHLANGRGLADFHSPIPEVLEEEESAAERSALVRQGGPIRLDLPPQAQGSYLQGLREILNFLQECSDRGWCLPGSEIEAILGSRPRRSGWSRYGFVFDAAGTHGHETAWAIRSEIEGFIEAAGGNGHTP